MTATSEPTSLPSALPKRRSQEKPSDPDASKDTHHQRPNPKLRLNINDLRHPASKSFLALVPDPASTLETALDAILKYLYTPPSKDDNSSD
ncbi:PBSP domain-containing protein, partial [Aspergillus sclerotialis]